MNGDNELDTTEVKTLLWLIEGEEPTDTRVEHDVGMIDNDGSGTIDKLEWIKYLGSSGGVIISYTLFIYHFYSLVLLISLSRRVLIV